MTSVRLTVCQLPDAAAALGPAFEDLVEHARHQRSHIVLLLELPAVPWFAQAPTVEASVWQDAVAKHVAFGQRLRQFAPAHVLSTRPINAHGQRFNEGFLQTPEGRHISGHVKCYLPEEPGWHEATWFSPGPRKFLSIESANGCRVGFQICTELMFPEWARAYGKQGVHLIAAPRASMAAPRWQVALQMAAIAAGAYAATSNRCAPVERAGSAQFGGQAMVVDPEGEVLATTTTRTPFVTVELDLDLAHRAKSTYPRNVPEGTITATL